MIDEYIYIYILYHDFLKNLFIRLICLSVFLFVAVCLSVYGCNTMESKPSGESDESLGC